jgi:hypothetical protein
VVLPAQDFSFTERCKSRGGTHLRRTPIRNFEPHKAM